MSMESPWEGQAPPVPREPAAAAAAKPRPARSRLVLAILVLSLAFNLVIVVSSTIRVERKGGMRYLLERLDLRDAVPEPAPYQVDWRAGYRKLPHTEGETVFLGDSLTVQGPWAEFFGPIKNRGIGGDTVGNVLERLGDVTEGRPEKIFLMIGTNDLAADLPIAQILRGYRKILDRIRAESPRTRVYALSVTPVNQHVPKGPVHDNRQVRELNDGIRALASEYENVEYVDVASPLLDGDGNLRQDLTYDGLHLKLEAYLIMEKRLRDLVNAPRHSRAKIEDGHRADRDHGTSN